MKWSNRKELSTLLSSVLNNKHSSFYKEKYRKEGIISNALDSKQFDSLPFLTRTELVETPLSERTFVPSDSIRFAAFTSGTSSGKPLITLFTDVADYHFEPSLELAVSRPLIIYPPLNKNFSATFVQQCRQAQRPVNPMFADFQNLANSALLAEEVGCDSLYATPTIAALFAEHARSRGIAGNFKLLALSSETLTEARRAELEQVYPNALIANLYASSEIGQFILFPCRRMMEEKKNHFHILAEALAAVELDAGELVVSYGLNAASPLVRYRTGDYFEELKEGCDCGLKGPTLQWSHREAVDRVRINGVEFDLEEADRVFANLRRITRPDYQIHFRSVEGSGVAIVVEIAEPAVSAKPDDAAVLGDFIASELIDQWKLSASATMRTALERGLFASCSVVFVPQFSTTGAKTKRFINHVR